MARKTRLHIPGGVYHAMLRGNAGQRIFFGDADRAYFSSLVAEGVERFGHRIHAYCWMDNHVHLAVQVAQVPLSRIMQNMAFRYARWINRRQERAGHVFQGRYKAILVDADSYLLELVRYIHLNPVRAGLVNQPDDDPWSGHKAYLSGRGPAWLCTHWVLSQFGSHSDVARARYAKFVMEGLDAPRQAVFHTGTAEGRLLGEDEFIERTLQAANQPARVAVTLDDIVHCVSSHFKIDAETLSSRQRGRLAAEARAWVAILAVETGAATLTEVGKRVNRDVATLSNGARQWRERIVKNANLASRLATLRSEITKKQKPDPAVHIRG